MIIRYSGLVNSVFSLSCCISLKVVVIVNIEVIIIFLVRMEVVVTIGVVAIIDVVAAMVGVVDFSSKESETCNLSPT